MDQNYNIVNKFVRSCYNLDSKKYFDLISEDCHICYHFNGKFTTSDKKTYCEKLVKGHFENTTEVKVISVTIINKGEYFETDELCHFTRKGLGRDETEFGIYKMRSKGILKILNNKIVHIQYMFNKEKMDLSNK